MTSYHNTNGEDGEELRHSESKALNQEDVIEAFFRRRPGWILAPHEVHRLILQEAPLTSVRRAMTNLTARGILQKTSIKTGTQYGKQAYCWTLADSKL